MIDFIKDADCTKDTPVRLGVPDAPIYGKGIKLKPRVDGRTDSEHFKKIYLPELLPLEEYDLIVVLISGGTPVFQMRSMKVSQPLMRFRTVGHQMLSMRVQLGVTVLLTRFQISVYRMYSVRLIFLMLVTTHQVSMMQ